MPRPSFPLADVLSRLSAVFARPGKQRQDPAGLHPLQTAEPTPGWSRPEDCLSIPVCRESQEDALCSTLQQEGQFLARQERWEELSERIATADATHRTTPGGMPESELLAYGARADVLNAVEHALGEEKPHDQRQLVDGIMALETIRKDHRDDPYLTALIALAHIDIGWLWRGPGLEDAASKAHLRRCAAHFERAAALLSMIPDDRRSSAFIAAADCALFAARREDALHVADAYARLIDLAPRNHRPMRALGLQMLPRCSGSYEALELEARRTAARTEEIWGAGGYAWVYFDALATDPAAGEAVDPRFFIDGLRDILQACPSQDMANLLSAYCAVAMGGAHLNGATPRTPREEIAKSAEWLIRDHLRELHPLVWAHAGQGFDNNARISSLKRFSALGQAQAMNFIAEIFREEIARGQKIAITPEGLQMTTG
ncbi:hypothetical protein PXK00_15065 [Phaeobacter sp. QD34_3]|uniref:hypothetical protein n=1 Tax=unclassified Phaeobacter TaxID=2621772 RepID=UPI00237F43A5|nr:MULTISPECIES: hypothetical protein [unclassified Phaeobacter]MDE4134442.1 hypothetical protein [Phaeobacter sp. QD34_3]MDE4138065.1 hypothetical protein [Phaeobacter sp. QD34_24]